jgi:regulator of protease activity HflC (stomatin/prohibitin superfamily)
MSNDEFNLGGALLKAFAFILLIVIVLMVAGAFWVAVPAGHVGVQDTFGHVSDDTLKPGFHFKSPFTAVIPMSVQTQKYMDYGGSADVAVISGLSNEGLPVTMGVAVNYHLNPDKVVEVYKQVGQGYANVVLVNPIHAVPRDVIAQNDVKTLYSAGVAGSPDRVKIEQQLFVGIRDGVNQIGVPNAVTVEQVYIRNIDLPQLLKDSISAKLQREQDIAKKEFDVQVQEKESDRMRVEAQGIADANRIIADSLSPSYLEWYTIEMMKAHSGATYFIPIGTDGRAMPELVQPVGGEA